jgi:FAD/FMN-containing dehydrogenase
MKGVSDDEAVRRSFARDASGLERIPAGVARPHSAEELASLMREAASSGIRVTPAGAQTSYVASSITDDGIILSLRGMDAILDIDRHRGVARVQPGAILGDVKRQVAAEGFLFAPDPTSEDECTVGGAIAANASGARSLKYGATRRHINALSVILANGERLELRRSRMEKNTAGFFPAQDLIDWFIGSEGTLGIVVEAELSLLPLPASVAGMGFPFPTLGAALEFVARARESTVVAPRCLELLDAAAFTIAREYTAQQAWAPASRAFVYVEEEVAASGGPAIDNWLSLAETCGAAADDARMFDSEPLLREARLMRHAVPSTLNQRASAFWSSGGRKISTDWAVPYRRLSEAIELSNAAADAHGVGRPVTFGHAGNGHPHQNYLARDPAEAEAIETALEATLRGVVAMGGTVSAEHGIGKLKKRWLLLQSTPLQQRVMQDIKKMFDPGAILSPGNVVDPAPF